MRPDTHSLGVADDAKDEAQNTHKLGGARKEKERRKNRLSISVFCVTRNIFQSRSSRKNVGKTVITLLDMGIALKARQSSNSTVLDVWNSITR